MRCDKAKNEIELSPNRWYSLPLLVHLAGCEECHTHQKRIALLYKTARILPRPEVALQMPETIRAQLPSLTAIPPEKRFRWMTMRVALSGMAVIAAISVGILMGPRLVPIPVSAATIQDAIQATNTWHLLGWRLKDGKPVKWEIWGRRTPFFYREQIGDEILQDNGVERIHVIPPNALFRRKGIYLKMPSRPLTMETTQPMDNHSAFLWGIGEEYKTNFYPDTVQPTVRNTVALTTGRNETTFGSADGKNHGVGDVGKLLVDCTTRLPIRYDLHRAIYRDTQFGEKSPAEQAALKEKEWIQASLSAQYNVALPPTEMDISVPANYQAIDFSRKPTLPNVPGFGVESKNGLTVATRVHTQDTDGNIRLQSIVWLGDTRPDWNAIRMYVQISPSYSFKQPFEGPQYPVDDQGRVYLNLNVPDADYDRSFRYATPEIPAETYEIGYLTPSEPIAAHRTRPTVLALPLKVVVTVMEPMEGGGYRPRNIVDEEIAVTVPLPAKTASLDYDRPRGHPTEIHWRGSIQHTLLHEVALNRQGYWLMLCSGNYRPQVKAVDRVRYFKKALYWQQEWLRESERLGDRKSIEQAQQNIASTQKEMKR